MYSGNRRQWNDALRRQALAAGLKPRQLTLDMPIRWNSTYYMLITAKYLRDPITAVCATQTFDLSMREIALTSEDWTIIQGLEDLFKIFLSPSQKMQASAYPTLNYVIPKYLKMIERLKMTIQAVGNQTTIGLACTAALLKLDKYYTLTTSQRYSHSAVATVCDPRMNLAVFQRLWPTSIDNAKRHRVLAQFRAVYNQYNSREYQLNTERIEQQIQLEVEEQPEPDSDDDLYVTTTTSHQEPEWKRWNNEGCPGPQTDILKYWAAKQYQYPVIAKIARDHLQSQQHQLHQNGYLAMVVILLPRNGTDCRHQQLDIYFACGIGAIYQRQMIVMQTMSGRNRSYCIYRV